MFLVVNILGTHRLMYIVYLVGTPIFKAELGHICERQIYATFYVELTVQLNFLKFMENTIFF